MSLSKLSKQPWDENFKYLTDCFWLFFFFLQKYLIFSQMSGRMHVERWHTVPPGKKNILWNHLTQGENYSLFYTVCVLHAFSYLSSSCHTAPLFLPIAIFTVIIFINPYILAVIASPFHTTELAEMPDFSTACTEDASGQHTQDFHKHGKHTCDHDCTLFDSCDYTAGKENPFLETQHCLHSSTDASLQGNGPFSHVRREGLQLFCIEEDFGQNF